MKAKAGSMRHRFDQSEVEVVRALYKPPRGTGLLRECPRIASLRSAPDLQPLPSSARNERGASYDQSDHQDGNGDENNLKRANLAYSVEESPKKPTEPVKDPPE
jgi:hypothetical protein